MIETGSFSAEERAHLEALLGSLQEKSGSAVRPTLASLLDRWAAFVMEVERGYELSIYDYTNDLSVRDDIEWIMHSTSEPIRLEVARLVQPWDERYGFATQSSALPLAPGVESSAGAWWFRIPTRCGEELGADLEELGLLDD